jgi:hypothetical protein
VNTGATAVDGELVVAGDFGHFPASLNVTDSGGSLSYGGGIDVGKGNLDRKLERMLTMRLRLKELRRAAVEG